MQPLNILFGGTYYFLLLVGWRSFLLPLICFLPLMIFQKNDHDECTVKMYFCFSKCKAFKHGKLDAGISTKGKAFTATDIRFTTKQ